MGEAKEVRSTQVNLRIDPRRLRMIDEAAAAVGQSRSDFMVSTAVDKAEAVLLDKRLFALDDAAYEQFMARLDAPPAVKPRLRALLHSKAPWDR